MKIQEELEQIKNEYGELKNKLAELTEDELMQVTGGTMTPEEKHRELKKAEDELLAKKQEYDTAIMK